MTELIQKTIGDLLKDRVSTNGGEEAVVYPFRSLRRTYQSFYERTTRLAKGLMALGIQKGEHIAIWATNVPEWIDLQFASARIGAVLVTVNTSYRKAELDYLLKQSDSTHLFLIDGYRDVSYTDLATTLFQSGHLSTLKRLVYIGDEDRCPEGMLTFESLIEIGESVTDEDLFERENSLHYDDAINMQYTSGTTGFPKGVMLTHSNIVNNAAQVAHSMGLVEGDRLCIPVPFFHCFGCVMSTLACVTVGAVMIPVETFDSEVVLKTVETEKCTALHGVPTMFIAELNHPHFHQYNLSTLRRGIMAGSPCPIEVMKKVIEHMGMSEITIAYGQTESSPVITQTRTADTIDQRVNTVGPVLPLVEVKVVDPLTNQPVKSGEQGELCTRGYHVMKGYYKNEEATNKAFDSDGWLHTGDLATVDENGYYRITGRLKDMIIRGGENIYPREIEEFIYTHPDVLDVQVVGVRDDKYGERVVAFVQRKQGSSVQEEDLKIYCRGNISAYKIPTYFFFVESYPMTASGKVQKYKLREVAVHEINHNGDKEITDIK